jgi:long-chain acyl-CoA synthetase
MLIVPNFENLSAWAAKEGIAAADPAALVARPEVQKKMDEEIRATLKELAGYERPKKLLLLSRDFTLESGELTPKMSIRRKVVEQRHAPAIEALYKE